MSVQTLHDLSRRIRRSVQDVLPLKEGHCLESLAAGLGYNTLAAYKKALSEGAAPPLSNLNVFAARDRMYELDYRNAGAFYSLLCGRGITIEAERRAPQRGWPDTVIYDLRVSSMCMRSGGLRVDQIPSDVEATFALPFTQPLKEVGIGTDLWRKDAFAAAGKGFYQPGVQSYYQIDSNHYCRIGDRKADALLNPEKETRLARLNNGIWEGALFIYDPAAQADAIGVLGRVKAQLARNILEAIAPGVRCLIFAPGGHGFGAWHISMTISAESGGLKKGPAFELPSIPGRKIQAHNPVYHSGSEGVDGEPVKGVFDSGQFHAHVYSSGVALNSGGCREESNPSRLFDIKRNLVAAAEKALPFTVKAVL